MSDRAWVLENEWMPVSEDELEALRKWALNEEETWDYPNQNHVVRVVAEVRRLRAEVAQTRQCLALLTSPEG